MVSGHSSRADSSSVRMDLGKSDSTAAAFGSGWTVAAILLMVLAFSAPVRFVASLTSRAIAIAGRACGLPSRHSGAHMQESARHIFDAAVRHALFSILHAY
jgi:hypothetical protein